MRDGVVHGEGGVGGGVGGGRAVGGGRGLLVLRLDDGLSGLGLQLQHLIGRASAEMESNVSVHQIKSTPSVSQSTKPTKQTLIDKTCVKKKKKKKN